MALTDTVEDYHHHHHQYYLNFLNNNPEGFKIKPCKEAGTANSPLPG